MKSGRTALGKLNKVELRQYWEDEARDFTPWLCEEQNLAALGEAIGMELEFVGREQFVGDFKLDILAKDTLTNRYVVIENQLEKTNHSHLGQLLTYASGYEAIAVVWVAKQVSEEHRKALDWLNERTSEDVGFFGIEIELWSIGKSEPAPRFNLVSRPNDWSRAMGTSSSGDQAHSETKLMQLQFWQGLVDHLESRSTHLSFRKPRPQHWYEVGVGRSNFHISLTLNSRLKRVGCELYIAGERAKVGFSQLLEQKVNIEKELGAILEWQELPHRSASRIIEFHSSDYEDRTQWNDLFKWFAARVEVFHKVFSKRVADLDLESHEPEAA